MHPKLTIFSTALLMFLASAIVATRIQTVHSQGQPGAGFAAVPGSKGGWDLTGPYDVVSDWRKPMWHAGWK